MEETDPAQILPAKKQVAEATASGSGGALPMVPPMGMPMSPHAPMTGQSPERSLTGDEQLYTADMPAEGFGSPAVALTEGQLLPATPGEPFAVAHAAVPAMTARMAEPLTPMTPARPVEDDVHILPVDDTPCTCCGKSHDGQENRPFDPDEPEQRHLTHDRDSHNDSRGDSDSDSRGDSHGDPRGDSRGDSHGGDRYDHEHSDHHRGEDVSDRLVGTHDGDAGTRPGEVTEPVPTDGRPDDCCCACCGDEHPGLDNVTGDHKPGGATDTDDEEDDDDSDDDSDGKSDGKSDGDDSEDSTDGRTDDDESEEDSDDDCPADDSDSDGKPGDDKPGDGKPGDDAEDSDDRPGDDKPGDKPGDDKPGRHDTDDKHGQDDDCDDNDDKPGKGEHDPADRPHGDRPSHHDSSANVPGGSAGKPVPPGQEKTPTDSNVAYDHAKKPTPGATGERETMAPPLSSLSKPTTPVTPTERGMAVQGKPLGERIPATEASRLTPQTAATPAIPATPAVPMTPLSPTTSVTPPVTAYVPPPTTNGQGNGGQQSPGGDGTGGTGGEQPQMFYKSEPPPGFQGNGNGNGDPGTTTNGLPAQNDPATSPMVAALRTPANVITPGNGNTNGNGNGNGNNPLFTTTGGAPGGGLFPPANGNVGPDPNVKFDEASYTQLTSVVGGVRDTLDDATHDDVTYLDAELLLQPSNQTWEPATKLITRGGNFGGSVDTESKSLEKTLKTFHESLQLAKEVFKETDDLAAYDATKFTTNYPGFNNGGLPGGVV